MTYRLTRYRTALYIAFAFVAIVTIGFFSVKDGTAHTADETQQSKLIDISNSTHTESENDTPDSKFKEFESLFRSNPVMALHRHSDSQKRDYLIALGNTDLGVLKAAIPHLSTEIQVTVVYSVCSFWAKKDPIKLASFSKMNLPDVHRSTAELLAIKELIKTNHDEAERVLFEMPKSSARNQSIALVADRKYRSSPENATAWVASLSEIDRKGAEEALAHAALAKFNLNDSLLLANRTTNPVARIMLTEGIAKHLAFSSSSSVSEEWLNSLPDELRDTAFRAYIIERSNSDIASATQMAAQIQSSGRRNQAYDSILKRITQRSHEEAVIWLSALPKDSQPRAAYMIASSWKRINAEKAKAWVASIQDPQLKERAEAGMK